METNQQSRRYPFEEMGNILLDAMQGTLICLDNHHIIVDVSATVKRFFGFEQTELVGLSIILLIEDSERDAFGKFLNNSQILTDVCFSRMMINHVNEYRQVKIQRRKKSNPENVDVHSSTSRHNGSIETILLVTLEETAFIDITLHDIPKQEFYTKMNLIGEIIFEDHRGAFITGYLPHEIVLQPIFNFVYPEDRLVKLHALWKCVTTGASKLQWRLNARDGSLVFLQTEYKLISDPINQETIVARNEVLSSVQRSQFDELQTAWKHQCTADIKGNSSSFKSLSPSDSTGSFNVNDECRICVPSLNMCFITNKLQPLHLVGNIFDGTKLTRPLNIQDYIDILIDNQKYVDRELSMIINNLQSLTARYRRVNEIEKNPTENSDTNNDDKISVDSSPKRKQDPDSIVRGLLSNSSKTPSTDESSSTLSRLLNGNGPPASSKSNSNANTPEALHQQHLDFIKKYNAAKTKLESQLELLRNQEMTHGGGTAQDIARRHNLINKLNQLEAIKQKHFARRNDHQRQTSSGSALVQNNEQKDFLNSLLNSSMETNGSASASSPLSSLFSSPNDQSSSTYSHQRNSSQTFEPSSQYVDHHSQMKNSFFDEFLSTPASSSSSSTNFMPVNHSQSLSVHSYMNVSFHTANSNDGHSIGPPSLYHPHPHHPTYPF